MHIPPLRQRREDIKLLADFFLKRNAEQKKAPRLRLSSESVELLESHDWPGNVRELRNVLERALVMFGGQPVTANEVRDNLLRLKAPDHGEEMDALWEASRGLTGVDLVRETNEPPLPHPAHYADWFSYFDSIDMRRHLQDIEVVLIEAALAKSGGMVSQAAEALKLRRTTLIEKMKKLMIERPAPTPEVQQASD